MFTWLRNLFTKSKPEPKTSKQADLSSFRTLEHIASGGAAPKRPLSAAAIAAKVHVNATKQELYARALSRDFLREGAEKRWKSYANTYAERRRQAVRPSAASWHDARTPGDSYTKREDTRRDTEDLALSAAVAASTHNAALGYMVGGSLAGAIIGSSMAEAASSSPPVPEPSECYRSSSYDPSPSYSSSYSSDSYSSSSSCDSSSSYSSSSDSSSSYSSSSDW